MESVGQQGQAPKRSSHQRRVVGPGRQGELQCQKNWFSREVNKRYQQLTDARYSVWREADRRDHEASDLRRYAAQHDVALIKDDTHRPLRREFESRYEDWLADQRLERKKLRREVAARAAAELEDEVVTEKGGENPPASPPTTTLQATSKNLRRRRRRPQASGKSFCGLGRSQAWRRQRKQGQKTPAVVDAAWEEKTTTEANSESRKHLYS